MALQFSDYIALVALVVSMMSAGFSISFGLRDRARVRADSHFYAAGADEDGHWSPPGVLVRIANHGRRTIYLEYLYFKYGRAGHADLAETLWEGDKYGRCRLSEGDKYEQFFDPDADGIFTNDEGVRATQIFFEDSLGRRYKVRGAKHSLEAYFAAMDAEEHNGED